VDEADGRVYVANQGRAGDNRGGTVSVFREQALLPARFRRSKP
jgi:hypothetical protein